MKKGGKDEPADALEEDLSLGGCIDLNNVGVKSLEGKFGVMGLWESVTGEQEEGEEEDDWVHGDPCPKIRTTVGEVARPDNDPYTMPFFLNSPRALVKAIMLGQSQARPNLEV